MTDCPDCQAAAERVHHGFRASCTGCAARSVARGPDFHRVRKAGKLDLQYRALLVQLQVNHAEVKAAAEADVLLVSACS